MLMLLTKIYPANDDVKSNIYFFQHIFQKF